jgi:hypothetical protein
MRPRRLALGIIAAWLGVIALGLNALVPIHLAFDLDHAFEAAAQRQNAPAARHDLTWRLLALLTGHLDQGQSSGDNADGHGKHHHPDCAVCSSLGTLAGFAPATAVPLAAPTRIEAPILRAATNRAPRAVTAVAYRSRAPPIARAQLTT